MKRSLEKKLTVGGLVLAVLLLGTIEFMSYRNAIALIASTKQVEQTEDDLNHLLAISVTLKEAEARQLAYLLLGAESDRQLNRLAMQDVDQQLQTLPQILLGDAQFEDDLELVESLVTQRQSLTNQSLELADRAPRLPISESTLTAQAQLINSLQENQRAIEQVLNHIRREKTSWLNMWDAQLENQTRYHLFIEHLGSAVIVALVLGLYLLLYRQLVQRQKAETLQQKLLQEKEMGDLKLRFFSMVSHEFRTPLSIVLGSAQLLGEKPCIIDSPPALKNLDRIQSSARSMNQLLSDILTLTRAEAGKLDFYPSNIDLEAFCLNLVEDIKVINHPPREIQFISQGGCPHACLDEKLLHALLSNLLSNALKYSPVDSPICLTLSHDPKMVTFEIRDQGIGIAQEDLTNLYEPFFRGENVGKTVGAGLGLAVSKKCVELHHGRIAIQSQVGQGTTVIVTLPTSQG